MKKLRSIIRIIFPKNRNTKSYFNACIKCLPGYSEFSSIDDCNIICFKSGYKIVLRDFRHSDLMVYDQVFVQEQYRIIVELLRQFNLSNYKIIDAGSNVGYTSLYLAQKFPNILRVVAIEPNDENVRILNKNITLNNLDLYIDVQHCALSNDNRKRFINSQESRDKLDWANTTIEKNDGNISAITVRDIIDNESWEIVDFLKIDIEGYEKELFQAGNNLDYLDCVRIIAIEVHEDAISKTEIELILKNKDFLIFNAGELTVGVNKRFVKINKDK
jgi:FkbM family methyltransferase